MLDLEPDPELTRKPRAKSVPDIFANKLQDEEQGSSDDHRDGGSGVIIPGLLAARRTLDMRLEEAVTRQRRRSQEGSGRHSEERPADSAV